MAKRFLIVLLILSVTSSTMLMGCSLGSLGGILGGLGGGGGSIIQTAGIALSVFSLLTTVVKMFTGGTSSTSTSTD